MVTTFRFKPPASPWATNGSFCPLRLLRENGTPLLGYYAADYYDAVLLLLLPEKTRTLTVVVVVAVAALCERTTCVAAVQFVLFGLFFHPRLALRSFYAHFHLFTVDCVYGNAVLVGLYLSSLQQISLLILTLGRARYRSRNYRYFCYVDHFFLFSIAITGDFGFFFLRGSFGQSNNQFVLVIRKCCHRIVGRTKGYASKRAPLPSMYAVHLSHLSLHTCLTVFLLFSSIRVALRF